MALMEKTHIWAGNPNPVFCGRESEGSQSRYGHESRGTRNQELLFCAGVNSNLTASQIVKDLLWGLVVRVLGYRSRGPGSIPGATRFSEK
jgi:hypothetical protein